MHTNEYGITKFFINRGYKVIFHVNSIGRTEAYDLVTPTQFHDSYLSKVIQYFFGQGRGDLGFSFPSFLRYFLLSRKEQAGIVFIKNPFRVFSVISLVSYGVNGSRIIFYSQSHFHDWSFLKWFFAKTLVKFTNSIWITPVSNDKLSDGYPKGFYYLPFVVDESCVDTYRSEERINLLMVGKYKSDRKNHKLFLDVVALLSKKYDIHSTVVGESGDNFAIQKMNSLKGYADNLEIGDRVDFYSNVDFSKMKEIYLQHDIFVLPASNEPAAISPLEAMANGLIPICSDSCGTKVYIENCFPDLVFDSNSATSLYNTIELLLSNPQKIECYKAHTKQCKKKFDSNTYFQTLRRILYLHWDIEV